MSEDAFNFKLYISLNFRELTCIIFKYLIDKCDGNERKKSKSIGSMTASALGLLPSKEADRPLLLFLLNYEVCCSSAALASKTHCFCTLMGDGKE